MSIIRAPRPDSGFVQIRNEVARDSRLSYKARGILVEILSRPDNWQTSADALARNGRDGRTAVLSGLRELRDAGYMITKRERNADGTIATCSLVFDTPQSGNPTSDNPTSIEHLTKNTESPNGDSAAALTEGQRVNELARAYTDLVPLSNFPAVAGVVRKAVRVGMFTDTDIRNALERLAAEGRSVTTDTLRYELVGFPDRQSNRQRALEAGMQRTRRLMAEESTPTIWELEA